MAKSPAHPTKDTDTVSRSSSLDNWLYVFVGLSAIGFLDTFGAPEEIRVFRLFGVVVAVILVLIWVKRAVRWLGSGRQESEIDVETTHHSDSPETGDPREWIETGFKPSVIVYAQSVLVNFQPLVLLRGMLLQLLGGSIAFVRHGGTLPAPDTYESKTTYHPPFSGTWTVINGSPDPDYSHSWDIPRQRYAYDFVITDDDGRTHNGTDVESFYCFDKPVLAPAAGTVVRIKDGHRDYHRTNGYLDPLQYRLTGNYVLIKHAENEYSLLAHLKEGSIDVSEGDEVSRGQEIARCGHSGNSTEPHLHFQVQDHSFPYIGASLPVQFAGEAKPPDSDQEGTTWVHCGQTLAPPSSSE